jgi:hypothetical protein
MTRHCASATFLSLADIFQTARNTCVKKGNNVGSKKAMNIRRNQRKEK